MYIIIHRVHNLNVMIGKNGIIPVFFMKNYPYVTYVRFLWSTVSYGTDRIRLYRICILYTVFLYIAVYFEKIIFFFV